MLKSLLVIAFVALGLWAIRMITLKLQNNSSDTKPPAKQKDMVQCTTCQTYIPAEDAIIKGDKYFCSAQHLQDWNKSA